MLRLPAPLWRAALFSVAVLAPALTPRPAAAAVVSYDGSCRRTTDVLQWTPQKGAVARFIADTFATSTRTGLWIGLGRTDTAFWSAEGGDPNDACDDCRVLYLVETKFDGTRKRHTVLGESQKRPAGAAAQKAQVLAALWKLAKKTWPADKLTQDYTMTAGKPPAKDPTADPAYTVQVAIKNGAKLRYDLGAKTSMCWCMYDWTGKKLSP